MNKYAIAVSTAALAAVGYYGIENGSQELFNDPATEEFAQWVAENAKSYATSDEFKFRREQFKDAVRTVARLNAESQADGEDRA